jgi:hypothetical protein
MSIKIRNVPPSELAICSQEFTSQNSLFYAKCVVFVMLKLENTHPNPNSMKAGIFFFVCLLLLSNV